MPAVLDRHIENVEDAAIGRRYYVQALRSLI